MCGGDGLQPIDEAHRERREHNLGPELGQIPNRHLRHDDEPASLGIEGATREGRQ